MQFAGSDILELYDTVAPDFMYARYLSEAQIGNLRGCTEQADFAVDGVIMKVIKEIDLDYTIANKIIK